MSVAKAAFVVHTERVQYITCARKNQSSCFRQDAAGKKFGIIPLQPLKFLVYYIGAEKCARSSMDRASDSGSECWGFESLRAYQGKSPANRCFQRFAGLSCVLPQQSKGLFLTCFDAIGGGKGGGTIQPESTAVHPISNRILCFLCGSTSISAEGIPVGGAVKKSYAAM